MRRLATRAALGAATTMLSACGGGGGGGGTPSIPTPPAATTPVTTAPVTTTPIATAPGTAPGALAGGVNDTAAYRGAPGAVQANALAAYDAGITGRGVTAAVIDSGIDVGAGIFRDRYSPASRDVAGTREPRFVDSFHGSAVAQVLAGVDTAGRTQGIAFGATILGLRADTPGSCSNTDECKFTDVNIAAGVDVAVEQHVRVINISLGGAAPEPVLVAALDRATAAGIIVVIAAGNEADPNPDPFAQVADNAAVARGLIVIAGATNAAGQIASFSDLAGTSAAHFLTALGERLPVINQANVQSLYTGTSFSAPLIAGAVALLAQAFPNLSSAQIVQLLYDSATDGGTSGIDAVYGRGILNLAGAFRPRGTTALAGSGVPVSLTSNGVTSTPMGDAGGRTAAGGRAVILDGLGRAYGLDLAATLGRAQPGLRMVPALAGGRRSIGGTTPDGETLIALTIARAGPRATIAPLALSPRDIDAARATAGLVARRIDPQTALALGFATGAAALDARLAGGEAAPFLIVDPAGQSQGFAARSDRSLAVRRAFGRFALALSAETGAALVTRTGALARFGQEERAYGYDQAGIAAERRFGPLTLHAGLTRLIERATVLGARFATAFGPGGARTDFADLGATLAPGGGWRLAARLRQGWTRSAGGGAALQGARFVTRAWSAELAKADLFDAADRVTVGVAAPLRVIRGGFALTVPTGYDYATGLAQTGVQQLGLSPQGHELDAEAAWQRPMAGGLLTANLYWRRDPATSLPCPTTAARRCGSRSAGR